MAAPFLLLLQVLLVSLVTRISLVPFESASNVISNLSPFLPAFTRVFKSMTTTLASHVSTFPISMSYYVSRPLLEEKILQVYSPNVTRKDDDASYTVIVGPKGAGKSSVVAHVLTNKPGVLHLEVSEANTEDNLLRRILETGGVHVEEKISQGLEILFDVFSKAKGVDGRRITVVLEVVRGRSRSSVKNSDGVLDMVMGAARKLARSATAIVVLSEANAALMFGDDSRQRFIWVDGMTHDEAAQYAKKLYPAVNDHDLELFLDKVGTLPLKILKFVEALEHGETAADYIESVLYSAGEDLKAFEHQQILKELKKSPDGVRAASKFQGVVDKGVNLAEARQVAVAMKAKQAIVYHLPSKEYRLPSRAHRTALLERWKPVNWWHRFVRFFTS